MSLTLGDALAQAAGLLHAHGIEQPRYNAEVLVCWAAGMDRTALFTHPEFKLTEDQQSRFRDALRRRVDGYPLQYLMQRQEFYGRDFIVTESVLIPRPDTETVVTAALELLAKEAAPEVLDVGTGSGCIGITIACERPDSLVTTTDISEAALAVAGENARRLGVAGRIRLLRADVLSPIAAPELSRRAAELGPVRRPGFDLIVSNPPYVADADPRVTAEVRRWEPAQAVFAGPTGFEIHERLLAGALTLLDLGKWLLLEIGQGQAEVLTAKAAAAGWEPAGRWRDLAGIERALAFRRSGRSRCTDSATRPNSTNCSN